MEQKIAFVSKKTGAFHLIVDAEHAPELFAAHLIRTRTNVEDYNLFSSYQNGKICSRAVALMQEYQASNAFDIKSTGTLSPRQIEIMEMIGLGLTYRETSERLYTTERAVKYHIGEIFNKLGMRSKLQLFLFMRGESSKAK